ncbi:hypothetical protein BH23ACT5_BH23ACT5_18450 [soil metagenome]
MTRYVTLAEYFWLAEHVTGVDADTLTKASRSDLADSALHAPPAGFGDVEFYPDIYDKAAVLVCRLAWNHPLPDGNKRAAWAAMAMFIDLNDGTWDPATLRTSTRRRKRCWPSLPATSTKPGLRHGSENASGSLTKAERRPGGPTRRGGTDGSQPSERSPGKGEPNPLCHNGFAARPEGLEPPTS